MVIAIQSKTQPDSDIEVLKISSGGTYVSGFLDVDLFRVSLENLHMVQESSGPLVECIKKLEKDWEVFIFKTVEDFYEWYKITKKK
jgi:hypothetical protein